LETNVYDEGTPLGLNLTSIIDKDVEIWGNIRSGSPNIKVCSTKGYASATGKITG
jgi:hypothetical protein